MGDEEEEGDRVRARVRLGSKRSREGVEAHGGSIARQNVSLSLTSSWTYLSNVSGFPLFEDAPNPLPNPLTSPRSRRSPTAPPASSSP